MDLVKHLTRLFAYDEWANREVLANLRLLPPVPRAMELMSHVFSSQRLWMERMEQKPQSLPVWPDFTLEDSEKQAIELGTLWKGYLSRSTEADLAGPVRYQNSRGESWSSRKDDILMHLITHSAYHRGQAVQAVRAAGFTPAYTDFIHGVRQGFVK